MCDAATQRLVEKVVREKVGRGEMFTAFEVSLEVQRRGSRERHRGMKHVVHNCFGAGVMAGYDRTLIRIPGAPCPAWLFHPTGTSPASYQPLARRQGQPAGPGNPPPGFGLDRRSRICVPARLLRQAGLRPGDQALVFCDPQDHSLAVARAQARGRRRALTAYRVDRYGNVRVGPRTLQKASLGGRFFAVDGDRKRITIRLAAGTGPAPAVP